MFKLSSKYFFLKKNKLINESNSYQVKNLKIYKRKLNYPNDFKKNYTSDELHKEYGKKNNEELKGINVLIKIAGRITNKRIMGKASFVTLQDIGGNIQLYVSSDYLGEKFYKKNFKKLDLGDIIGACGNLFRTKSGELSIRCSEIRLLTKAIKPLPSKFHKIENQEIRYRQRYLDLMINKKSREIFIIRSKIIKEIRNFMEKNNFIEVETPMMQPIPGGATAKPFITYHYALNTNMYLRIAPELYLKQLVIGGFEKVFEINRSFRNEGISSKHNPEFTMMEFYIAYANYEDIMKFLEKFFLKITKKIFGKNLIYYENKVFDFRKKFKRMTMKEAICHYIPKIKLKDLSCINTTLSIARYFNISIHSNWGLGRIQSEIFEKVIENNLIEPTFITTYPTEVSPLSRRNDNDPFFSDRFELFIGGKEIGNGSSELNDAEDQANRFNQQIKSKCQKEDENFLSYDKDYINALKYGLPPTAGFGIGIDRLIMLFTNKKNIRDVILFPILRKKNKKN